MTSFSQKKYYTTDGRNRLTEAEANKMLSEQVDKMSKVMGKQLYGSLTVDDTQIKNNSIISKI